MANANLKADKLASEKDRIEKGRSSSEQEMEELRSKVVDLENVKIDLIRIKEEVDVKESEIDEKIRENEVLKVNTIVQSRAENRTCLENRTKKRPVFEYPVFRR